MHKPDGGAGGAGVPAVRHERGREDGLPRVLHDDYPARAGTVRPVLIPLKSLPHFDLIKLNFMVK